MRKSAIILKGVELGVPFDATWSCYRGGAIACGTCPSCRLRKQAFFEAGVIDPIKYEK
jgi:7-cyano-7-deazaguanine synthase